MLEYFYCYDFCGEYIRLVKMDSQSNETIDFTSIDIMPIDKIRQLVMKDGGLLLGPWCIPTKNRLRLIDYYHKDVNQTKVRIYKNSHKNTFSLVQNNLVIGHMDDGVRYFNKCRQVIREGGRQKVIKTGVKNVHAFIEGHVCNEVRCRWAKIKYCLKNGFIANGKSINFDNRVVKIQKGNIYISV